MQERHGTPRSPLLPVLDWGFHAFFHAVGVVAMAIVLTAPVVSWDGLTQMAGAVQGGEFVPDWLRLGLHVGLAACAWAFVVIGYRLLVHRGDATRRVVRLARGTVMTETLIVLVPFLLLTSGLAQLAMNNVASVMAHYGAYQGARAAWLWQPEANAGRWGANDSTVRVRARLAAAAALAPTAPSNFVTLNAPEVERLRGTMTATFANGPFNAGTMGRPIATAALFNTTQGISDNLTFAGALDDSTFAVRAARKITFAYHALDDLEVIQRGDEVGVRFTYQMHQAFPWFAYIFGQQRVVGGRIGYYSSIEREYTITRQVDM